MVLLERLTKEDWTQASWGESDPPFVGRKQPEQSQINPKKRKPRRFAKILKGDPYHDELGRFSSTEGAVSGSALKPVIKRWTASGGGWQNIQHAARIVIGGAPDSNQAENKRDIADATKLLASINAAPTIEKTLYRGLSATTAFKDAKVGDTYSESLTSWTGKKDVAADFASNSYGSNAAERTGMTDDLIVMLTTRNAKGLSVSDFSGKNTMVGQADEWLTSGEYKITGFHPTRSVVNGEYVSGPPNAKVMTVERVGNARGANIRKSEMFAKMLVRKDWTTWNQKQKDGASKAAWSASDSANNARSDNVSMMKLHSQAQQAHENAAQGYAKESNQYKEHMSEAATHARRSNDFRDKSANDKGFSTGASRAVNRAGYGNSSF